MQEMMKNMTVAEKINFLFIRNESLEERIVRKNHPRVYEEAVHLYGTWKNCLREIGLKKRKMNENERFYLYHIVKRRYEKYGEEALRPKNMEPELKEQIVERYKTLKALKTMVLDWDEDKIIYEVRKLMITGSSWEDIGKELKEKKSPLGKKMVLYFEGIEDIQEEYHDRFRLDDEGDYDAEEEQSVAEDRPVVTKTQPISLNSKHPAPVVGDGSIEEKVYSFLQEIGYFQNKEVAAVVENVLHADHITKQELLDFLFTQIAISRESGTVLTEESIEKENYPMYIALKKNFNTLQNAFQEMTKMYIG